MITWRNTLRIDARDAGVLRADESDDDLTLSTGAPSSRTRTFPRATAAELAAAQPITVAGPSGTSASTLSTQHIIVDPDYTTAPLVTGPPDPTLPVEALRILQHIRDARPDVTATDPDPDPNHVGIWRACGDDPTIARNANPFGPRGDMLHRCILRRWPLRRLGLSEFVWRRITHKDEYKKRGPAKPQGSKPPPKKVKKVDRKGKRQATKPASDEEEDDDAENQFEDVEDDEEDDGGDDEDDDEDKDEEWDPIKDPKGKKKKMLKRKRGDAKKQRKAKSSAADDAMVDEGDEEAEIPGDFDGGDNAAADDGDAEVEEDAEE